MPPATQAIQRETERVRTVQDKQAPKYDRSMGGLVMVAMMMVMIGGMLVGGAWAFARRTACAEATDRPLEVRRIAA
jgi:hypothetical protein